jgi:hypothetical protein
MHVMSRHVVDTRINAYQPILPRYITSLASALIYPYSAPQYYYLSTFFFLHAPPPCGSHKRELKDTAHPRMHHVVLAFIYSKGFSEMYSFRVYMKRGCTVAQASAENNVYARSSTMHVMSRHVVDTRINAYQPILPRYITSLASALIYPYSAPQYYYSTCQHFFFLHTPPCGSLKRELKDTAHPRMHMPMRYNGRKQLSNINDR